MARRNLGFSKRNKSPAIVEPEPSPASTGPVKPEVDVTQLPEYWGGLPRDRFLEEVSDNSYNKMVSRNTTESAYAAMDAQGIPRDDTASFWSFKTNAKKVWDYKVQQSWDSRNEQPFTDEELKGLSNVQAQSIPAEWLTENHTPDQLLVNLAQENRLANVDHYNTQLDRYGNDTPENRAAAYFATMPYVNKELHDTQLNISNTITDKYDSNGNFMGNFFESTGISGTAVDMGLGGIEWVKENQDLIKAGIAAVAGLGIAGAVTGGAALSAGGTAGGTAGATAGGIGEGVTLGNASGTVLGESVGIGLTETAAGEAALAGGLGSASLAITPTAGMAGIGAAGAAAGAGAIVPALDVLTAPTGLLAGTETAGVADAVLAADAATVGAGADAAAAAAEGITAGEAVAGSTALDFLAEEGETPISDIIDDALADIPDTVSDTVSDTIGDTIGDAVGGAAGGDGGSTSGGSNPPAGAALLGLIPALLDAYGSHTTAEDRAQAYEDAANAADPFREFRSQYADQLNTLYNDPSGEAVKDLASYQFQLGQGEEAMRRRQAASGNRFSGQALVEAQTFGQGLASQVRQQEIENLLSLSGANVNPGNAANLIANAGGIQGIGDQAAMGTIFHALQSIYGGEGGSSSDAMSNLWDNVSNWWDDLEFDGGSGSSAGDEYDSFFGND